MKFADLLLTVGTLPLFRGSLLLAGDRDPADVRRQLARWMAAGKILQLRRNVYALAPPWRRVHPHPFLVANELHAPSYVSLQSALAHHGLVPEAVPVTTSVTTARPVEFDTPLGRFTYRHLRPDVAFGYEPTQVAPDQEALVADPAKALLDLVYLTPDGDSVEYLSSLRLAELDVGVADALREHARRWDRHKITRAARRIVEMHGHP